jgi:uncharacterized membrane protein
MGTAITENAHTAQSSESGPAGSILDGHYAPPPADGRGKQWVRASAFVLRSTTELYDLWHDVAKVPLWQEQIAEVRLTGPTTSHWVMMTGDDPDKRLEWDSEILNDEPGKRIAWRSIDGDSHNAGKVVFETAPGGRGTIVTVLQEFRMSKLASAWETVTGRNPKQAIIENLRHFKALAETGEIPRTQGQPHGPRGTSGKVKKSLYGETIATPAGTDKIAN